MKTGKEVLDVWKPFALSPTRRRPVGGLLAFTLTWSICIATAGFAQGDAQSANDLAEEAYRQSRLGDIETAIDKYRAALEIEPTLHRARFELARHFAGLRRFEDARAEFATLVAMTPEDGAARRGEVTALLFLDRWVEARTKLEEALVALPRDGQLAHLLARVLASAPVAAARDGKTAQQLAEAVYQARQEPDVFETVAMAYAEQGDFANAIDIQRTIIGYYESRENEPVPEVTRRRLDTYIREEPWRAESPMEIVQSTELPQAQP